MKEAIQWVQGRIDALPGVFPEAVLPPAVPSPATGWKLTPEELARLDAAAERIVELRRYMDRESQEICKMMITCTGFSEQPISSWFFMPGMVQTLVKGALLSPASMLSDYPDYNPASIIRGLAGYAPAKPKA